MIRTQVQIKEDQIQWLRNRAKTQGVSVSQLIREGIDLFRFREDRRPEDRKKRALAVMGRFSSGRSDIASHHDDYLSRIEPGDTK